MSSTSPQEVGGISLSEFSKISQPIVAHWLEQSYRSSRSNRRTDGKPTVDANLSTPRDRLHFSNSSASRSFWQFRGETVLANYTRNAPQVFRCDSIGYRFEYRKPEAY